MIINSNQDGTYYFILPIYHKEKNKSNDVIEIENNNSEDIKRLLRIKNKVIVNTNQSFNDFLNQDKLKTNLLTKR